MMEYHDTEWGVPLHEDQTLFEFLILEGAQAGLTWQTILNKRENYRKAFDYFQVNKIAKYGSSDVIRLLADSGIIRNCLKIESTILNAKAFLRVKKEFNTFDAYIWKFVGNSPIIHSINMDDDDDIIPVTTKEADTMSKDLIKRGFKFVGPTICYAFMQAVGMVNDHEINCFRHKVLK